jgi:hypothetical protein
MNIQLEALMTILKLFMANQTIEKKKKSVQVLIGWFLIIEDEIIEKP